MSANAKLSKISENGYKMLQARQVLQGRYYLQQSLGQNAGRQTWLAEDRLEKPPTLAIVKLLAFSPQMQWDELKLFEREAQILKNLDHPRIPKYRGYFSIDRQTGNGLCWFGLVQEYIPGTSLQQLLDRGHRFSKTQVRSLATQLLEILTYLHGLNPPVLHRDIKPSNLILAEDQQVYLVDFGAVADPAVVEGATFTIVGTAGYAPLEQFWGKAVPASDLYALGATLIHLLTGTAPADLPQSNLRVQFSDRVSLKPNFIRWIELLTEPDLDRRFSSADAALEALKTGRHLALERTLCQPAESKVRLKKYPNLLLIEIPRSWISFEDIVEFCTKLILAAGSIIFMLLPNLIVVMMMIYNYYSYYIIMIIVPLIICMIWCLVRYSEELVKVLANLKEALLTYFGHQYIEFGRYKFVIGRKVLNFRGDRHKLSRISKIEHVDAIPSEGVIIQTETERYVFGEELSASDRDWLLQEIQERLKTTNN